MLIPYRDFRPKINKDAFVAPTADLIGQVTIAKDASIWFGAVLRGDINAVRVGQGSNVQDNAVLHVEKNTPCIVKKNVTIGHQATVHACTIENSALIGIGARVLNHAVVGHHSLIAAGAIVLEGVKIPPRSLVIGLPGKVVRKLTDREITALDQSASNYIKLSKEYKSLSTALTHPMSMSPIEDLSRIFG
ncbi:MAG: carbonic anhydrase/acetyltransferase-like protein (isoleucine patch superfamily) [Candidatus Omnitrophota bacterium]|jgi:carbonic anhydrase/acetyltransferase-like protein (isoleucine patch superfamily)